MGKMTLQKYQQIKEYSDDQQLNDFVNYIRLREDKTAMDQKFLTNIDDVFKKEKIIDDNLSENAISNAIIYEIAGGLGLLAGHIMSCISVKSYGQLLYWVIGGVAFAETLNFITSKVGKYINKCQIDREAKKLVLNYLQAKKLETFGQYEELLGKLSDNNFENNK